jgi:hypothetical protein
MSISVFSIVQYCHFLIPYLLKEGRVVVDATCGNGHDSLFLCNLMQGKGFLYSFDVQESALSHAKHRIEKGCPYSNYKLINDSHDKIHYYIDESISLAVYNLGYLPGGNPNLTTKPETTIASLRIILNRLEKGGYVLIAAYIGHDNGQERDYLYHFLKSLDSSEYRVANHRIINIDNYPPELFIIKKMHATK